MFSMIEDLLWYGHFYFPKTLDALLGIVHALNKNLQFFKECSKLVILVCLGRRGTTKPLIVMVLQ